MIVGIRPEALDHTRHEGDGETLELRSRSSRRWAPTRSCTWSSTPPASWRPTWSSELAADGGGVAIAERTTTLLTARLPPHTRAAPGRVLTVRVDTRALHFFDPETELAL